MRMQFPLALCFTIGILMLVQYFIPHPVSDEFFRRITSWSLTIGVFALVLGIGSLIHLHWSRTQRRSEGWSYSIIVLVALVLTAAIGLIGGYRHPALQLDRTQVNPYAEGTYTLRDNIVTIRDPGLQGMLFDKGTLLRIALPAGGETTAKVAQFIGDSDDGTEDGTITVTIDRWRQDAPPESGTGFAVVIPGADEFFWLFDNIQVPLDATMFSLIAFFIASAAFRAFRARNLEATLLLLSASIVLLGLTPPFVALWNNLFGAMPGFPTKAKDWLLEVPNLAARRAIMIGVGLGAISQSFRIILGIERSYLGGGR